MADDQQKKTKLLAYWLFSTVVVVCGAITAYIGLWTRPAGATTWVIIKTGFPIWGIVTLAAVIIFAGYYFWVSRQQS